MTQTATRRSNTRKPTIYEALVSKLGRVPTAAELKADVERIKREAYEMVAGKGKLPHQRKRRNPTGPHLPIYSVSITQAKSVPSRGHGFVSLGNARKAAAKEGSQFIAQVKDSHLKHVVYLIPSASFSVADLDSVVRAPGGGFGAHETNPADERTRLRKKQDFLLKLISKRPAYTDDMRVTEGGPTIGQLRQFIFPQWEGAIDQAIRNMDGDPKTLKARKLNPKSPSQMTAGELNKALDRIDALTSKLTQEFIDAGRGHERPSEYLKMNDPLANRAKELYNQRSALQIEKDLRYGPGAPGRLPTGRGFGPRRQNPSQQKFLLFNVSLQDSPPDAEGIVRGTVVRVSRGTPVEVLRTSKHRMLLKADLSGRPLWGWVDDSNVAARSKYLSTHGEGPEEMYRQRNPESASESMYSSFHGVPSTETLEYEQDLHYHGNLAALGELVELKVNLLSGDKAVLTFDAGEGEQQENPRNIAVKAESVTVGSHVSMGLGSPHKRVTRVEYHPTKVGVQKFHFEDGTKTPYISRDKIVGIEYPDLTNPTKAQNPFWPFSSHSRTVIYHLGSGDEYKLAGTHKGYKIYKEPSGGFAVPKLDADSRFDTKKDAEKFIDSWKKARPNPSDDSDYSGFGKYAYSVYWGVGSAKWPMTNGYYATRKEAEERAKLERRKSGGQFKYAVKKVEHRAYNPKHKHGPFHEAGKLFSKGSSAVSKPLDQFTDVVGKVGGYLDDRIGKALNPRRPKLQVMWHGSNTEEQSKEDAEESAARMKGMGATDVSVVKTRHQYKDYFGFTKSGERGYAHKGWKYGVKFRPVRTVNPQVPSADSVMLTSNEKGTQLYLVGGDQSLNLSDLNIDGPAADKEHIAIGDVTHIVYRTRKDFDKLQETDYIHQFSEDTKGPLPELVYDRINKRLSLVGGVYFIKQPLTQTSPGIED